MKEWLQIRDQMKTSLPAHIFQMFIQPLAFKEQSDSRIILTAPNNLLKKRAAKLMTDYPIKYAIEVHPVKKLQKNQSAVQTEFKTMKKSCAGRRIRADYTFSSFVAAAHCKYARDAIFDFISTEENKLPGFLLVSGSGNGKTHLLQAAANQMLENHFAGKIMYLSADDFSTEMVDAYRRDQIREFKERFRSVNILLLEDIHLVSGKNRTQEDLALILDHLYNSGKKVIFSVNQSMPDLSGINPHLKARLQDSLFEENTPADMAGRIAILKSLTRESEFPDDVIEFLAARISENIRVLKASFFQILHKSKISGLPVDLHMAGDIARNVVHAAAAMTPESIKKVVCRQFNIDVEKLNSSIRNQNVVIPRNIAIFLCRRHTNLSLSAIAASFNRKHSTIIHSINSVEIEIKNKSIVEKQLALVEQQLFHH